MLSKRTILFATDNLVAGGKERRLVQLLLEFGRRNKYSQCLGLVERKSAFAWKRTKHFNDRIDYPEVWEAGVDIQFVERVWKKDPITLIRFWRLVRRVKPCVINTWSIMASFYALPVALWYRIPLVVSYVADCNGYAKFSLNGLISRAVFLAARTITGNSSAGIRAYHAPKEKAIVIYNGFDWRRVRGLRERKLIRMEMGVSTEYVVTMVARFDQSKDWSTYIGCAQKVLKMRPDVTFLCVGQGELLDNFQALVDKSGCKNILFPGHRKNIEEILSASDISVLVTSDEVHKEGISNTILESCAVGVPVIATNSGGTPEILIDGYTGFLIPPYSESSLIERVVELLDNKEKRDDMGRNAVEVVNQRFSIELMGDLFERIFEEMIRP